MKQPHSVTPIDSSPHPMAPPPPPELVEDAVAEILLRMPPEEPAHLIRASLVCKLWRRILTNPDFLRHYRRYHRSPPLLGFFHRASGGSKLPQRFVPATAPSPFSLAAFSSKHWMVLDCRHGRVLLQRRPNRRLLVWDPVTGHLEELRSPYHFACFAAAVLCAAAGCDHSDCRRGGPFQVLCVGFDHTGDWRVHACVYSSQVGAWGEHVHLDLGYPWEHGNLNRAVLIRDEVCFYFDFALGPKILKYDLCGHCLSEINLTLPDDMDFTCEVALMPTEEGLLGLAVARDSNLYLCSRMVNAEGVAEWVQCRVIELHKMLDDELGPDAIGFAEGLIAVFVNTNAGLFIVDLKSEEARKVGEGAANYSVLPVMSFYTPDCGCSEVSVSRIGKLITSQPK